MPIGVLVDAAGGHIALNYASPAVGGPPAAGPTPAVLFIGAEFCPICAAERWPMTLALAKFGTFTHLQKTHSATADGNAGTWSYEGATYTSRYLTFQPYELYTNQPSGGFYEKLDHLPTAAQAIWSANLGSQLSFPFIDFGGHAVLETSQFNPALLYNHPFDTILAAVGSNENPIGLSIDASAAVFAKYLCGITGGQPAGVCGALATLNAPISGG